MASIRATIWSIICSQREGAIWAAVQASYCYYNLIGIAIIWLQDLNRHLLHRHASRCVRALSCCSARIHLLLKERASVSGLWATAGLVQMDPCTGKRDWMKNVEQRRMSYESLKAITDNFSDERLLGSGAFGMVYKGTQPNGEEIAVKVLRDMAALDEKNFMNEFQNLARLKHPNIVQLVGFCNESKEQIFVRDDGTKVNAEKMHVALCFEYLDNGCLHDHISDECRLEWHICYKIIKGVCEGLKHLSEGLESPIWHLDLKPMNILLDKEMIVKIADFGLSRLIGDERTRKTLSSVGTRGYLPPEYIRFQLLSKEFDIFSLGVIITKIMVGDEGYNNCADMPRQELVEHVYKIWEKKLHETVRSGSLDVYCQQVKTCIEIASKCLMEDRKQRPSIQEIVIALNETEIRAPITPLQIEQFQEAESIFTSNISINFMSSSGADGEAGGSSYTNNRSIHPYVKFPYELVRKMTNNFSEDGLLGHGKFGRVYRGVYEDGQAIAVKVPTYLEGVDAKQFENEVENISKLKHKNIVQTVGYSCETKELPVEYNGRMVIAEKREMLICFEYLENGSLEQHISDEFHGLEWRTRYEIIKGVCQGLKYLHEQSPVPLIHLDLKPSNILLDKNMVPKLADFGLSRLLNGEKRAMHTLAPTPSRTLGYLPPEYINKGVISMKHDIYSLGIIMRELVTGRRAENLSPQESIEPVLGNWRTRLQATSKGRSLEGYCKQVETSIQIAMDCVGSDRSRRPSIRDVIRALGEMEMEITLSHDGGELLDVRPTELRFPFHPRKYASSLLQLRNMEHSHVAFKLLPKSHRRKYLTKLPLYGIVPPRCTYNLVLTSGKQPQRPLSDSDEGFVLQSIAVRDHQELQLQYLESIFKKSQESADDEVQEVTLKCICDPTAEEASSSSSKLTRPEIQIITRPDAREVTSIQVHPTKPWIMTTHQGGNLRIWNYQTLEILNPIKVPDESVYVAKFMMQAEWIVAGDGNGCIHVCSYDDSQDYTSFEGHNGQIMSLAVHPTDSYVLSSSHDDHLIKLWQWDKSWDFDMDPWVCTRIFEGHSNKVPQLIFNPDGTGSFASASWDGTVKIWDPNSDVCNTVTLDMHPDGLLCVDFITGADRHHLITVSKDQTAQIWDLDIDRCREYLQGHANHASVVYCHEDLQKLITSSVDGTIRIWDSTTYRLENIVAPNLGAVSNVGYIQELQRIVVGCRQGIAMTEIKFP